PASAVHTHLPAPRVAQSRERPRFKRVCHPLRVTVGHRACERDAIMGTRRCGCGSVSLVLLGVALKVSLGAVREFHMAAVELGWDYLHTKNLELQPEPRQAPQSKDATQQYMKAVYWEYTDSTFSTPKPKAPWTGPTIRAEVNDKVVVHFKNFASQPYSVHPVGISYWKQSEEHFSILGKVCIIVFLHGNDTLAGAGYDDATSSQEKEDDAVAPGGSYRYVWDIQPASGPTLTDPECLTYSYSSQVDIIRDLNSGLIGALLICKAGALGNDGHQKVPVYILLFAVFDEARSWYGESRMARENLQKSRVKKVFHTINGYVNSTLPGLKLCQKTSVFWHLIGMGSSSEIHSIRFQDHTLQVHNHRKVLVEVTPMSFATAEMKPVAPGKFLISCQIHSHQIAGMNAHFTVDNCPEPAEMRDKKNAIHTDDYEYDITLEGLVSTMVMNSGPNVRSSVKLKPKVWEHYIAAEEVVWDYAPELSGSESTSDYVVRGPQRIGKVYKKAAYVEYTDKTFRDLKNNGVIPNETAVYMWTITAEDGPTKADPRCLTRLYQSTVNPERDLASGLVGHLIVCYRKTLDKRGNVLMSDRERHLTFAVFDENKSWYIEENIQKYTKDPSKVDPNDPSFYKSNVMYNVNGLMYNNLNFMTCLGDVTLWHVLNVGTQSNFLSVYFMGNTFERDKMYETVLTLFPMSGETVSMEMETAGEWEITAFDSKIKKRGMSARYTVQHCERNALVDEEDYYDYLENNIVRSSGSRRNRTLAVKLCKRPKKNNVVNSVGNATVVGPEKPVCVVKYITLTKDDKEEDFSDNDIPEEVLLELEKENVPVTPRKNITRGSFLAGLLRPVVNSTSLSESGNVLGKQCGSTCQQRRKKRALAIPVQESVTTTPHSPTTHSKQSEDMEKQKDYVSSRVPDAVLPGPTREESGQQNQNNGGHVTEGDALDRNLKEQLDRPDSFLAMATSYHRIGHAVTPQSILEAKAHDRPKVNRLQRQTSHSQQENPTLKYNFLPEKEDSIQTNNVRRSLRHVIFNKKDLSKASLDLQELDLEARGLNVSNSTLNKLPQEYDYYTDEENETSTTSDLIDNLDLRSTEGKYRSYYIAAEEIMWDYGLTKPQQLFKPKEMRKGMRKYLPKYKKVVFRAYLDQDFKYPASRGELEEHLGIMGPVIKAEINDFLTVTFKNLASRPFSFHLHGVFDRSQGQEFGETLGEAVQPQEVRVYNWKITKRQGPSPRDFNCKAWTYYSTLNMASFTVNCAKIEKDINSGLIGPLIVCKPGTLNNLDLDIQEFYLLFNVFDETKSWYFDENIKEFCTPPCQFNKDDPWLEIGNKFAAINGYVAETLPGLLVPQHHLVHWHLLNMGGDGEFHAVHFHGLPFTVRSDQEHRMGVYRLYPGVFGTVEMRPAMVGTWMVECSIGDHQLSGMRAKLLVYSPSDWEARLARLELSGSINAWSGLNNISWIQVDLQRPMLVHEIRTQGASHRFSESFVLRFTLSYSLDNLVWKTYKGNSTISEKMFSGNTDGSRIKSNFISPPMLGRYIRVNPIAYRIRPTLRMELYGCDLNSCSMPMGMEKMVIPNHSISASSFFQKLFLSWSPSLARLNFEGSANAWRPKTNNPYEWIQVDFKEVKRITGVITQGARSFLTHMMVTEFTVSFSNNGHVWSSLQDESAKREKVFHGNNKYDEEVLNIFEPPLFTRYIRIHPKGWYNDIALRLEFLGCDTQQ
ncbi:coagulation factor VIII-like, partial [Scleropages formosus]